MKRFISLCLLFLALYAPLTASAWWDEGWTQRRKVLLDTTPAGANLAEPVADAVLLVRLHTGNFFFGEAKPDGSDLRFVTADDKTPLQYHIEKYDDLNELALVWVKLPRLPANSSQEHIWLYYGNPKAASGGEPASTYDAAQTAVFHFAAGDGSYADSTANGLKPSASEALPDGAGFIDGAALFAGKPMRLDPHPALALSAQGGLSVSAWLRADATPQAGVIYAQEDGGKPGLRLALDAGTLVAQVGGRRLAGGSLAAGGWHHVALTVGGGRATLYLDGAEVAAGEATLPELQAAVVVGSDYAGAIDELQLARVARPAAWVKAVAAQGAEDRLLRVAAEVESTEGGGGHSYFGILVDNLTLDAWVVIAILGVMFAISAAVMMAKALFIQRTEQANAAFMERFRRLGSGSLLHLDTEGSASMQHSSLLRLYEAGHRELRKRFKGEQIENLSAQSIDAIKASIDADLVRETHRLNSKMVLLTIAISGGPFLGLLGTVVGVMITFAAIAAAGDVNVNAIAPGIAAALLATVAGLGVAIPALFGYNWLASRVKTITADMHIFVDEFVTRVAEDYTK
jgi:biopolymer transport protein ExbB